MSPQENANLAARAQAGDAAARDELILGNMRLVHHFANRYSDSGADMDDLVSEGTVGLIRGIDRFRPELGFRLSTYVSWWILHAIHRCLWAQTRVIRAPAYLLALRAKWHKMADQLGEELGRDPTEEEIAEAVSDLTYRDIAPDRLAKHIRKLDITADTTGCAETTPSSPNTECEDSDESDFVFAMLDRALLPPEAAVIRARFYEGLTLSAASKVLGMCRERVRQIQKDALTKLRENIETDDRAGRWWDR